MKKKENDFLDEYINALRDEFESIASFSLPAALPNKPNLYISPRLRLKPATKERLAHLEREKEAPEEIYIPQNIDADLKYLVEKLEEETKKRIYKEKKKETHVEMDIEEALARYSHLVIEGGPGIGKTSLLIQIAFKKNREPQEGGRSEARLLKPAAHKGHNMAGRIPVFVSLPSWVQSGKTLAAYILEDRLAQYGLSRACKTMASLLKEGQASLLLDGFDEPTAREKRDWMIAQLGDFRQAYGSCRIVLTTRSAPYPAVPGDKGLPIFTHLELLEFDDNRIRAFVDEYFSRFPDGPGQADDLMKLLLKDWNEDIKRLAQTPSILSIIVSLFAADNGILMKRSILVRRIVDILLESPHRQDNRYLPADFLPEHKKLVLGKIAYRNHSRQRCTITGEEILQLIEQEALLPGFIKAAGQLVLKTLEHYGSFIRQLFPGTYGFTHLVFQEYFAALEVIDREDGIAILLPHLPESWWENTILSVAGLSDEVGSLVEQILDEGPDDIFYSNLRLAGKCAAEANYIDPYLKDFIARDIWMLYNNGDFRLLKESAGSVLVRLKPTDIIEELVEQLTDVDTVTRRKAAETLGIIGDQEVLPALMMTLSRGSDSYIRTRAAAALGQIGSREAMRILVKTLDRDEDWEVRKSAAEALGSIGSSEAQEFLLRALVNDLDPLVRSTVAEILGKSGRAEVIPRLEATLENETAGTVRWRILLALGRLKGTGARDVLIQALGADADEEVRESAAEALGMIGSVDCIQALITALSNDKKPGVRSSAAAALGVIEDPGALPALVKALISDEDGEVRGRAAYALGRLKSVEAIPYLVAAFNAQKESIIRGNVAYALGEIGGTEAIPFLVQALAFDKDSYVRYRAAEVLGSIGNVITVPHLKSALRDEGSYYGWRVKDKAYEALEKISRRFHVRITWTTEQEEQ